MAVNFKFRTIEHNHPKQDDNCPAAEGEGDRVAKYVSRPETYWAHVEHPHAEGGEAPCV